jgi:hypothetical protein
VTISTSGWARAQAIGWASYDGWQPIVVAVLRRPQRGTSWLCRLARCLSLRGTGHTAARAGGELGPPPIEVSPTIANDDRPPHTFLAVLSGRLVSPGYRDGRTAVARVAGELGSSRTFVRPLMVWRMTSSRACVTGIGAAISRRDGRRCQLQTSHDAHAHVWRETPKNSRRAERCRRCSSLGGMRNGSGPSHGADGASSRREQLRWQTFLMP